MILYNGVLLLVAANLAVTAALGLSALLRFPWPAGPFPVLRPDRWYEKRHPKTTEKREDPNEETVE